jgi:hypothetical protein
MSNSRKCTGVKHEMYVASVELKFCARCLSSQTFLEVGSKTGRASPIIKNYSYLGFLTRFLTDYESILKAKNPLLGRSRPVKMQ